MVRGTVVVQATIRRQNIRKRIQSQNDGLIRHILCTVNMVVIHTQLIFMAFAEDSMKIYLTSTTFKDNVSP